MAKLYHLVLIEHIPEWEVKGWTVNGDRIHVNIGGWASVYMEKEADDVDE